MKYKQTLEIALFFLLIVGCGVAWVHVYVIPNDQMREATNACVERERAKTGALHSKELWTSCWRVEAESQNWAWSNAPKPKRQAIR